MKNARDIIELIRNDLGSIRAGKNRAIILALEDGAALAALGITDDDTDAVEEAYAIIKTRAELDTARADLTRSIRELDAAFACCESDFGAFIIQEKKYSLLVQREELKKKIRKINANKCNT